jgi:D-xylono/L-arabinono-1,4-lactonase
VDVLARLDATVGECPLYHAADDILYVVDIPAGRLWRCPLTGSAEHVDIGEPLGCVAFVDDGGGFLLGTRTGVAMLPSWGAAPHPWLTLEPELPTQCNDGRCDSTGRFVVGTATTDQSATGALYLVDHDGTVSQLVAGIGMSNGIDWSPDGRVAYHADSVAGTVTRYPWDAEILRFGPGRVLVAIDPNEGVPDGLTIDDEGCMWLAVWGAGEVRRYDDDGRLLRTVRLPTAHVSSCSFGGAGRDRLFVTTARAGIAANDPGYAEAGAVFVVDPGVTGPLPTPFRRRGES